MKSSMLRSPISVWLSCSVKGKLTSRPESWVLSDMWLRNMRIRGFGVLLLEAITRRGPVDYGRPAPEVNLVDWLKIMVGSRRLEEVVDSNIDTKPSIRALLTALRCADPDSDKRPRMSQVVRMLESEEYPIPREDRGHRRARASSIETDIQKDSYDTDKSDGQDLRSESRNP